jgi:hypothetical protein
MIDKDALLEQLQAMNNVAAIASKVGREEGYDAGHKSGYALGLMDGRIAAFNEVLALIDKGKAKTKAG